MELNRQGSRFTALLPLSKAFWRSSYSQHLFSKFPLVFSSREHLKTPKFPSSWFLVLIDIYSRRNFNNLSFMSGYAPLKEESERDSQSGEDYEALLSQQETLHRRESQNGFFWLLVVLIPITSVCLLGLGAWIGSRWFANPSDICPAHVQHYCEFSNTRSYLWIWCWSIKSSHFERSGHLITYGLFQRFLHERERIPIECWPRGRCSLGISGHRL